MKKFSALLLLLIFSCNDGDVITESIEFGDTFEACGELVLFKTKSEPSESISFQITDNITVAGLLETTPVADDNPPLVSLVNETITIGVSESSNILTFRSYESLPSNLFCNDVPPANLGITQDFTSTTGTANFIIELEEDDNDGIPAELEDDNDDGDFNPYTNPTDTDGDGLPNFLDPDDDGDNVLTIDENPNYDATTNTLNPQNTDGIDDPDYLDTDDDNDGVLTINEEGTSANQNPLDDIQQPTIGPDYLNDAITDNIAATAYREHSISQQFTVTLNFSNLTFPTIIYDAFPFGTLNNSATTTTRTYTPEF